MSFAKPGNPIPVPSENKLGKGKRLGQLQGDML